MTTFAQVDNIYCDPSVNAKKDTEIRWMKENLERNITYATTGIWKTKMFPLISITGVFSLVISHSAYLKGIKSKCEPHRLLTIERKRKIVFWKYTMFSSRYDCSSQANQIHAVMPIIAFVVQVIKYCSFRNYQGRGGAQRLLRVMEW